MLTENPPPSPEFIHDVSVVLTLVWKNGGKTFGGTSRDLLRGVVPNDLDISVPNGRELLSKHFPDAETFERRADRGSAYYDYRIKLRSGLVVDYVAGFISVTDMDVNLVTISATEVKLLYKPLHLIKSVAPLVEVLTNIRMKQFVPLEECETHHQYRWDEFVKRGWKKL